MCIDFLRQNAHFICKISTTAHCTLACNTYKICIESSRCTARYRPTHKFRYFCSNHTDAAYLCARACMHSGQHTAHCVHARKTIPCHNCWVNGAHHAKVASEKVQAKHYRMRKGLRLVSGLVLYLYIWSVCRWCRCYWCVALVPRGQATSWMHQYACASMLFCRCVRAPRLGASKSAAYSAALGSGMVEEWSHTHTYSAYNCVECPGSHKISLFVSLKWT